MDSPCKSLPKPDSKPEPLTPMANFNQSLAATDRSDYERMFLYDQSKNLES